MDVKELLKKGYIVLDGAMGTMLQKKGMKMGVVPETLGIYQSLIGLLIFINSYIEAGADIVYANTFGANRYKVERVPVIPQKELISAAIENGRRKHAKGSESIRCP